MLDHIRELAESGQWQEVIQLGLALLASDHGLDRDDVAWVHLTLCAGYVNTADSGDGWRTALHHASVAYGQATPGGMRHTGAMQKLASLLVDMGRPAQALGFARAYLKAAPNHPALAGLTPFVVRVPGDAYYQQRQFLKAASVFASAADLFRSVGNEEYALRTQLNVVWSYARADRPEAARRHLPTTVPDHMSHLLDGAIVAVLSSEQRWADVVVLGERALAHARLSFDYAEAAEVALFVARAYQALGAHKKVATFMCYAVSFAARQDQNGHALLVLNLRVEGGDTTEEATAPGSGGFRPDCCFTTGIA